MKVSDVVIADLLRAFVDELTGRKTQLNRIERKLDSLLRIESQELMDIETLAKEVQANTDAEASASKVINEIAVALKASKNDPAKIQALADQLIQSRTVLASAIVAGTDAEGTSEPPADTNPPATSQKR
jgi:hypothetical protein